MTPKQLAAIEEIKTFYATYHFIPTYHHKSNVPHLSHNGRYYEHLFGSFSVALELAGLSRPTSKVINCLQCDTQFKPTNSKRKFCSHSCAATYNNLRRNPLQKANSGPRKQPSKPRNSCRVFYNTCLDCSITFISRKSATKYCSPACRSKRLSFIAKQTGLGGNRNRSAAGWYTSPIAGRVFLESSYELAVAKSLDEHNIQWSRPSPLPYTDAEQKSRLYYPDFHLTDYDVYLDPKNDFLIIKDREKIERVQSQNNEVVIVLDKTQLSWSAIQPLIIPGRLELPTSALQKQYSTN